MGTQQIKIHSREGKVFIPLYNIRFNSYQNMRCWGFILPFNLHGACRCRQNERSIKATEVALYCVAERVQKYFSYTYSQYLHYIAFYTRLWFPITTSGLQESNFITCQAPSSLCYLVQLILQLVKHIHTQKWTYLNLRKGVDIHQHVASLFCLFLVNLLNKLKWICKKNLNSFSL